jgi:hypothetical protein
MKGTFMSTHPEFECLITQMRSLESMFLASADTPVTGKDLLPICEAIRALATRLSAAPTPDEPEFATAGEITH